MRYVLMFCVVGLFTFGIEFTKRGDLLVAITCFIVATVTIPMVIRNISELIKEGE